MCICNNWKCKKNWKRITENRFTNEKRNFTLFFEEISKKGTYRNWKLKTKVCGEDDVYVIYKTEKYFSLKTENRFTIWIKFNFTLFF